MKMKILTAALLAFCLMAAMLCAAAESEEEAMRTLNFELDAYGGTIVCTYADGSVEETGGWGFSVDLEEGAVPSIGDGIISEDDVFEGWMPYAVEIAVDEDGFEDWTYVPAADGALYSTDELLALTAPETQAVYAAKWAGIDAQSYSAQDDTDGIEIYLPSITLMANGGMMTHTGEEESYEADLCISTLEPGMTINDVMELSAYSAPAMEGKTFAGWTLYAVGGYESYEEGDDFATEGALCFEVFEGYYSVVYDYELIAEGLSMQELGELVCGDTELLAIAQWE